MQRPEFREAAHCAVENVANYVLLELRKLSKYFGKVVKKKLQKLRERSNKGQFPNLFYALRVGDKLGGHHAFRIP